MGNWSLYGILLIIGVFVALLTFILSQINVTNPITGIETSILSWLWDLVTPW